MDSLLAFSVGSNSISDCDSDFSSDGAEILIAVESSGHIHVFLKPDMTLLG